MYPAPFEYHAPNSIAEALSLLSQHGGDAKVIDDYTRLPTAPGKDILGAARDGFVTAMRAEAVGRAAVGLGAGREKFVDFFRIVADVL